MRAGTQDSRTYIGSVVVDSHGKIGWEEPGGEHIGSFHMKSDGTWDPGKGFDWAAIPGLTRIPRMINGRDGNIWWEDYPGTQTLAATGVAATGRAPLTLLDANDVHNIISVAERRYVPHRKEQE